MPWFVYLAYFIAGLFLANGIPHLVNGISGKRFPSPFASPPGVALSSAMVNVAWGFANFVIGVVLIAGVGDFVFGLNWALFTVALGFIVCGLGLAYYFGRP